MMKHLFGIVLGTIILAVAPVASSCATETVRVAVQKTGTFAWELAVIRAHGLDREANISIDVSELASTEAGKIALRSGNADLILSDWLWVSRERSLGAKDRIAMVGYVFDENWGNAHRDLLRRFLAVTSKAKDILSTSDADWETIAPLTGASDPATLRAYRDRYREGIPRRAIADEEADARVLYRVLAEAGGRDLVGTAQELAPGTFYHPAPGE